MVVRTLDAGPDKALPFLGQAAEPNPALGVRGIRTAVTYPQLLRDQLVAIKEINYGPTRRADSTMSNFVVRVWQR